MTDDKPFCERWKRLLDGTKDTDHATIGTERVTPKSITIDPETDMDVKGAVPLDELRAFIKCQRNPWISRTEDEYELRKRIANELEEVIEEHE